MNSITRWITFARFSWNHAASLPDFFKLIFYALLKPSLAWRGLTRFRPQVRTSIGIRLNDQHTALTIRDNKLDISTFVEIFGDRHLDPNKRCDARFRSIYDVGANVGISSLYFAMMFPDAQIYAFEPETGNYDIAKRNLESFPNASISNIAVGKSNGTMGFHVTADTRAGRLIPLTGDSDDTYTVNVWSISELIERKELLCPEFLKVDVEGAEMDVLSGIGVHAKNIRLITVETHSFDLHQSCRDWIQRSGFHLLVDVLSKEGFGCLWAARK